MPIATPESAARGWKKTAPIRAAVVAASLLAGGASADDQTDFALNVTRHVLLHEAAHALIREFGLPILGNEETMADAFATVTIAETNRDDAARIIGDRARSWLIEAAEVPLEDADLKGEHELDARRAYRSVCLLYGADPSEWSDLVERFSIGAHDADDCSDIAPDLMASWAAVLAPHRLEPPASSRNVVVWYGEAANTEVIRRSGLMEEVAQFLRHYDWPAEIVLHFDACGREAAYWSRKDRRILLCDEYFARFLRQAS